MAARPTVGAPAENPVARRFAEAHELETVGRFDDAFMAFAEANKLQRALVDADGYAARHALIPDNLKFLFDRELFQRHKGGHPSRAPIFIVGFPRSGSTLLEQILATHSKVQAMGEITALQSIVHDRYPYPGPAPAANHFWKMGADYLDAVRALGWRDAPRFVDKHLINYRYLGSIRLAFPNATIIHSVRDPVDACLSCFRLLFEKSADTQVCYDLTDLGRHYVRYREIMAYWASTLPGAVIDVDHDELVADFPARARRLVESCGLRWEERCLRFYENPREVLTSSRDQVRRPIFTDSIGRWRRYEKHLAPLFRALGPYAPSDAPGSDPD